MTCFAAVALVPLVSANLAEGHANFAYLRLLPQGAFLAVAMLVLGQLALGHLEA